MATYFYPGIPCREEEYERVRRFWHDLVATIARQTDQETEWLSWGATTFADGTPLPRDVSRLRAHQHQSSGRDERNGHVGEARESSGRLCPRPDKGHRLLD